MFHSFDLQKSIDIKLLINFLNRTKLDLCFEICFEISKKFPIFV